MRKNSSRSFTLIELLVVLAVIAILVSIALPVFNSVQEKARITQDMSNLRQLGIATQTYLNDHDGVLFTGIWMGELHPKYLPSWKIFQSPFDNRSSSESDTAAPISYGANSNSLGFPTDRIARPTAFILFAPAQTSSAVVTFAGTPANAVTVLKEQSTPGGAAPGGTQNSRGRINALFADLHSDSLTWTTFKTDTSSDPQDDAKYRWTPAPGASPTPPP